MPNDLKQIITGNNFSEIMNNGDLIANALPIEQRKVFQKAFSKVLQQIPRSELAALVNSLTLEQIIEHAAALPKPIPIASGERDGLKFQLFDPPAELSS